MAHAFPGIRVERKSGDERIGPADTKPSSTLLDFWRWSSSDLVSNTMRGILAEYLVALALDVADGVRVEWDAYDVISKCGKRVEVKSSAYLQTWPQTRLSTPVFGVAPTKQFDETGGITTDSERRSDVYVFALLAYRDKPTVNPLDTDQWHFYVVPTTRLNTELGSQKTLSLPRLQLIAGGSIKFQELRAMLQAAFDPGNDDSSLEG